MTQRKQEKLMFILVILYIREYLCFCKIVSEDFQFRVSGSRNNQKHTALSLKNDYKYLDFFCVSLECWIECFLSTVH